MEIKLHILTEMLTAVMLIIGGVSVLRNYEKLINLHYVSQGMLIYSIINSSGYYIDLGELMMVAMFGFLLIGVVIALMFFKDLA